MPVIPKILVVTDIGNDYDDVMALLILGYYHKIGKVQIKAIIVTGQPVKKRCRLAHWHMKGRMGIQNIEISCGSETVRTESVPSWQGRALEPDFIAQSDSNCKPYLDVARTVLEDAGNIREKLRLLSIACLTDTCSIINQDKELFSSVVEQIHVQGGCEYATKAELLAATSDPEKEAMEKFYKPQYKPTERFLAPRNDAKNNRDDMSAAREFFKFMQNGRIPCTVYTKLAAFDSKFKKDVFNRQDASEAMKPVAEYLFLIHDIQKEAYYNDAVEPNMRHLPFMDTKWFVDANTQDLPAELAARLEAQEADPSIRVTAKELMPFTVVTSYDPIAALGCIQDVTLFPIEGTNLGISSPEVSSVDSFKGAEEGAKLAGQIHESLRVALEEDCQKNTVWTHIITWFICTRIISALGSCFFTITLLNFNTRFLYNNKRSHPGHRCNPIVQENKHATRGRALQCTLLGVTVAEVGEETALFI